MLLLLDSKKVIYGNIRQYRRQQPLRRVLDPRAVRNLLHIPRTADVESALRHRRGVQPLTLHGQHGTRHARMQMLDGEGISRRHVEFVIDPVHFDDESRVSLQRYVKVILGIQRLVRFKRLQMKSMADVSLIEQRCHPGMSVKVPPQPFALVIVERDGLFV